MNEKFVKVSPGFADISLYETPINWRLMFGLVIAGFAAVAGGLIWNKIIVPFDRVLRVSEELNDPNWARGAAAQRLGYKAGDVRVSPDVSTGDFGKDLQNLNVSIRPATSALPQPESGVEQTTNKIGADT